MTYKVLLEKDFGHQDFGQDFGHPNNFEKILGKLESFGHPNNKAPKLTGHSLTQSRIGLKSA